MPKPYSSDVRQKVINAIQLDGMRKSEAAQLFQLSRNTIDLWRSAAGWNRRLSSQVKSSTSNRKQDHWLGQVRPVC